MKKKNRKVITLNVKLEVLKRFDSGEKLSEIAKALGLATSTIGTIRDNKAKIHEQSQVATPRSVTNISRHRSVVMDKMETLLSAWIEENTRKKIPINTKIIQEKGKCLFDELKWEIGNSSSQETFTASKGWFEKFKRRHQLHRVRLAGGGGTTTVTDKPHDYETLAALLAHHSKSYTTRNTNQEQIELNSSNKNNDEIPSEIDEFESEVKEKQVRKKLSRQKIALAFEKIEKGLEILIQNDPDEERSNKVFNKISNSMKCYKDLYLELDERGDDDDVSSDESIVESESVDSA